MGNAHCIQLFMGLGLPKLIPVNDGMIEASKVMLSNHMVD
jgi:hypothetical protein